MQWLFQQNGDKLTLDPPLTGKPTMLSMMDKNETPTVRRFVRAFGGGVCCGRVTWRTGAWTPSFPFPLAFVSLS